MTASTRGAVSAEDLKDNGIVAENNPHQRITEFQDMLQSTPRHKGLDLFKYAENRLQSLIKTPPSCPQPQAGVVPATELLCTRDPCLLPSLHPVSFTAETSSKDASSFPSKSFRVSLQSPMTALPLTGILTLESAVPKTPAIYDADRVQSRQSDVDQTDPFIAKRARESSQELEILRHRDPERRAHRSGTSLPCSGSIMPLWVVRHMYLIFPRLAPVTQDSVPRQDRAALPTPSRRRRVPSTSTELPISI
ncbi:hypothetical protein NLJ89_g10982 [Agrocybe chaxingu]|uniref:Uncharacterized protein n=1 Tax=Agrocybe chaxingu TaxID=84603 RepID=A0A9W8JPK1_9AGAR|nr:hypothetical protein NLJ89_g10982 [Agrocybe chaxingu]